jgi:hypothetical protein
MFKFLSKNAQNYNHVYFVQILHTCVILGVEYNYFLTFLNLDSSHKGGNNFIYTEDAVKTWSDIFIVVVLNEIKATQST